MAPNVREFDSFVDAAAFIEQLLPGEEMRVSYQFVNDHEVWTVEHFSPVGDPVVLEQDLRRFRSRCYRD